MSSKVDAAAELLGDLARRDVPLGPMTTYRVGGAAALFVELADAATVAAVKDAVSSTDIAVLVVGKGSNLLVADAGFDGLAVTLAGTYGEIELLDGDRVRAGGAVSLPVLARRTAAASLTGFEWAVGVPGSVGGAVRMNAGGHGSDMSRCLTHYVFADLRGGPDGEASVDALRYSYRHSSIEPHQVVLLAELQLAPGDQAASEAEIAEIVRWRREHQPGGQNAGSVFTNPEDDSAGRLIESVGLKGHRRGSAYVSPKHANFFQADDGGSADDVRDLIEEVQQRVEQETGTRLVPELRMVGLVTDAPPAAPRLRMDPRIRERRVAVARDAGRRRLRIVVIISGAVTLLGAAYGITRTPVFDVDEVRVLGAAQTPTADIVRAGDLDHHPQLADVEPTAVVTRLEQLPWVQRARVVRHWPGTVEVTLVERTPVATLPAGGGGWALVDDTGRILAVTPEPTPGLVQLGTTPAPTPGANVTAATLGGLAVLDALPPSLSERVNGLTIAEDGVIDVHAVGLPIIHFGPPTAVRAKLVALTTLVARTNLKGASAIDVRVPTAPVLTRP